MLCEAETAYVEQQPPHGLFCLFICLSLHPSVCPSVCLSVCLVNAAPLPCQTKQQITSSQRFTRVLYALTWMHLSTGS